MRGDRAERDQRDALVRAAQRRPSAAGRGAAPSRARARPTRSAAGRRRCRPSGWPATSRGRARSRARSRDAGAGSRTVGVPRDDLDPAVLVLEDAAAAPEQRPRARRGPESIAVLARTSASSVVAATAVTATRPVHAGSPVEGSMRWWAKRPSGRRQSRDVMPEVATPPVRTRSHCTASPVRALCTAISHGWSGVAPPTARSPPQEIAKRMPDGNGDRREVRGEPLAEAARVEADAAGADDAALRVDPHPGVRPRGMRPGRAPRRGRRRAPRPATAGATPAREVGVALTPRATRAASRRRARRCGRRPRGPRARSGAGAASRGRRDAGRGSGRSARCRPGSGRAPASASSMTPRIAAAWRSSAGRSCSRTRA